MVKQTITAVFISGLIATGAIAADNKKFEIPRTEFGHPELRGVWNFSSNTPLQRPAEFADREFLTQEEVD